MQSERRVGRRSRCPAGPPMRPGFVVSATTIGPANGRRSHRPRMVVRSRRRRPDRGEPAPSRGGVARWDRPGKVRSCGSRGASQRAVGAVAEAGNQLTSAVVVIALVSAISGLLYGYNTGVISWALLQLTEEFNLTAAWKQVVAASILLGAIVGALACSWLSDRFGRRGTLLMLSVLFIVGALWCADAPDVVVLSLGRLVLGFAVGGATQTALMYVAELAVGLPRAVGAVLPDRHRGGHPRR